MLYKLVLCDLNNFIQKIDELELKLFGEITNKFNDNIDDSSCNILFIRKMINNPTDNKSNINQESLKPYHYYISNNIHYKFFTELNNNSNFHQEKNYLNLIKELIYNGDYRETRNGFTYSLFGKSIEFDINKSFPLLTTKKVFFRGIIEELIFFLRGKTDSKLLESIGVNIWKPNTNIDFIKSRNLNYREGDMGPMYGFNWLHFGAKYEGCDYDYTNKGFNQLDMVLKLLKDDPMSRRIIMTTYNPSVAEEGVLYPCHGIVVQFYVNIKDNKKYVSCNMYQRSADIACGIPFNIASYAAFVYIICQHLGEDYVPDKLVMNFGDIHLYEEHIKEALIQIEREPYEFPKLEINKFNNFKDLKYEDFKLINYKSHDPIKYIMKA